ncbi:hypothetical protein [Pseudomonas aeruginosa]|uniref:hypothetical protein n=1 Tax=Pseudomonas aeruginosa TaxID=287 RepID=UPI002D76CF89|nr:hypothetical protein [Pseudomonas aeruginosa]WRS37827.1 hypothetical protein U9S62_33480 [Pseudomonas aeruginosa]
MKKLLSGVVIAVALAGNAFAGEFDFDWNDKNDMRGAWKMCATTGFTEGDCPKVYQKCWEPPMIYKKKKKIRTYCKDSPSFGVSDSDKDRYLQEGQRRANEGAAH